MPILSVERRQSTLDNLFQKVGGIDDLALQAEFSRYLCIRVSTYVEQSVEEILTAYAKKRSNDTVGRFVEESVRRNNLKSKRLLEHVARFDPEWSKELESYMKGERKDALDSVVDNRNNIAHGDPPGITYHRIALYYERVKEIVSRLDELCLP